MPSVENVLRIMMLAGAATEAFKQLLDQVLPLFATEDQQLLREAYEDARRENDEGHTRLQENLAAAAQR